MNKTTMATVSLALLGAAGAAQAQSSVTLYGVIDAGLSYVSNADQASNHRWGTQNGTLSGSRWGLKGQEDLGGGLKAIFQLENGFDPGTGQLNQSGREFGRQAFVGVTSDTFGTVTLGRQYDPSVDMVQGITGDNYFGSLMATPGDIDNYDNSLRVSNAVKYVSPNYAGFQVEGIYGFSNLTTTGQGHTWGGAATYNNGPFAIAASYLYANNQSAGRPTPAGGGWNSPSSDSLFNTPINIGYQTASAIGIARAAAQYAFGPFTFGASYSNAQYKNDGNSLFNQYEKFDVGNGFVNWQLSPALLLGLGYTYTHAHGDTSATYHQASLGSDYSLSKRTDVFALAAYQHASGTQKNADGTTTSTAQASVSDFGYLSGSSHQEIVIVGIRHKF
ncbi:porin [Caballeronia choica]|uniref:Porin n=1 Tax=Caballeronia choica TaxID=326476 RepID=A0A158KM25_9BURK|nr:porin [Caballeronia choica]SAL82045.1 porin [Caballeronia choica]